MSSLSFPLRMDRRGRLAVDQQRKYVDQSRVLFVLGTAVGERVMRPQFGASIANAVANTPQTIQDGYDVESIAHEVIKTAVRDTFAVRFPDLSLVSVDVTKAYKGSVLYVDVVWEYPQIGVPGESFSGRIDVSGFVDRLGN